MFGKIIGLTRFFDYLQSKSVHKQLKRIIAENLKQASSNAELDTSTTSYTTFNS